MTTPTKIKGPGEARTYDGTPLRIGIVHARWNTQIISALLEGTLSRLRAAGVRGRKARTVVDQAAAVALLQAVLDRRAP